MDYEKKYKEALERAREYHSVDIDNTMDVKARGIMEYLFPELEESESEKIRKSLIVLLQHFCKGYRVPGLDFPVSYKDMLAWLEKQGGQKSTWSKEDDVRLQACIDSLQAESLMGKVDTVMTRWLKSLKQRIEGRL